MNYLGRLVHGVKDFYNDLNPSILSGAIDVIVIYDKETGTYRGSPFHVKFGKFGALRSRERHIEVKVNGFVVELNMRLGKGGEGYFKSDSDLCTCKQCNDFDSNDDAFSECETSDLCLYDDNREALSDDYEIRSKRKSGYTDDGENLKYDFDVWEWGEFPSKVLKNFNPNIPHEDTNISQNNIVNDVLMENPRTILFNCSNDNPVLPVKFRSENTICDGYRVSLCGNLKKPSEKPARFDDLLLTYETLDDNPLIVLDKDVVVEYKNRYYPWVVAAPMVVSTVLFGRQLNRKTIKRLTCEYNKKQSSGWFKWRKEEIKYDYQDSSDAGVENETPVGIIIPVGCKRKSLTLSSDKLLQLNLNHGRNDITFTIYSRLYGRFNVECRIYLWNSNEKLVISDIDGTITRSDVLGHVSYFVGKDWTHSGVTKLLTAISDNGYKIVYLSSRTIGIAQITRNLLSGINKDSLYLPDGPILLSPSSLFRAIHTEIIIRKPEIFKIDCLSNIRNLFFGRSDPFYAGFGNRQTDALSYQSVGVNDSRIFITNTNGEIMQMSYNCKTLSFEVITSLCEHIFPKIENEIQENIAYSNFNDVGFWNFRN